MQVSHIEMNQQKEDKLGPMSLIVINSELYHEKLKVLILEMIKVLISKMMIVIFSGDRYDKYP